MAIRPVVISSCRGKGKQKVQNRGKVFQKKIIQASSQSTTKVTDVTLTLMSTLSQHVYTTNATIHGCAALNSVTSMLLSAAITLDTI